VWNEFVERIFVANIYMAGNKIIVDMKYENVQYGTTFRQIILKIFTKKIIKASFVKKANSMYLNAPVEDETVNDAYKFREKYIYYL